MSFLDPAIAVTLIDVAEDGRRRDGGDPLDEASEVVERGVERARELGRTVEYRVARGEAGPEIVRAAVEGKFDAIFMSLRGVYRRGDTTAFASNTRYVLENAPCRVILGFAPKSIPTASQSEEPPRDHRAAALPFDRDDNHHSAGIGSSPKANPLGRRRRPCDRHRRHHVLIRVCRLFSRGPGPRRRADPLDSGLTLGPYPPPRSSSVMSGAPHSSTNSLIKPTIPYWCNRDDTLADLPANVPRDPAQE